jgi:glycerol uptake facilitator protein
MVWPLVDQVVGTAFLLMFVLAVIDTRNQPVRANLAPFVIGLAVAAIGMSYGANAGYAINPARDFGPRLLAYFAGWGKVALPGVHDYFWVPIVGPFVGGVLGVLVYDWLIHTVLVAREVPEQADVASEGRTVIDTGEPEPAGEHEEHARR